MKLRFFTKLQNLNYDISRVQEFVETFVRQLYPNPFLRGVLLEGVTVGTSDTEIIHKLGTTPSGWIILDNNTNCTVWRTADFSESSLTLQASSACTLNIWVF